MPDPSIFNPDDFGRIGPVEQADALRTLVAVFATSVVRPGEPPPRNAVTAEILDIMDEVPADRAEAVAQLFTMLAMRLRRRGSGRRTVFRLAIEAALLAHSHAGGEPVESEVAWLAADQPGLGVIDAAGEALAKLMERMPEGDRRARLTAQAVAAALVAADRTHPLGGPGGSPAREPGDLAVAEFLLRAAAQYLAATGAATGRASRA